MRKPRVAVSVVDHVATVTLQRADKHNALDAHMFHALVDAAAQVAADAAVRVVVLHGEGKSFCSGLDVRSFMSGPSPMTMAQLLERPGAERASVAQQACTVWIDLPVPVIVAIQGNCFGGGLQIALGGDVRFATPNARLSIMEIRWGLVPDMGITQTLPRLMRIDHAKELTYTGRQFSGEEAVRLGLITKTVADPLLAAQELAAEIAAKSPSAVQHAKQLYDTAWNTDDLDSALILESQLQRELIDQPNQRAAIAAELTSRPGVFENPARHGTI